MSVDDFKIPCVFAAPWLREVGSKGGLDDRRSILSIVAPAIKRQHEILGQNERCLNFHDESLTLEGMASQRG